ncbi:MULTISPECIES: hypothetical protein [Gammaproteobacteria]|uniref:Inner membrane protein n=1 Tax=Klebsiella quasipneumoniae subsp. quasipneumoniae TaxID=1667327 RepID=A0AAW8XXW3_9ENTR|nr:MULTISPECIES: hypothetical protein [Gammaproteobacteria]EKO3920789.1 hypothetical protein [Vibrio metschnikovii]BEJ37236.1 hypothetical protein OIPHN330_58560 [Citrobacter freundii]MCL1088699.1 hypothetical protein [Shewanella profunda]MDV0844415.1 hypothetical protein [Klebsiella quasipneumoniae subsp. quasipneumoniae]MDX5050538.1 hypothetical protein [Vibrio cholerae]
MMWIVTAMYFVVVSGLLLVGFVVYGKTLFFLGRSGAFAKYVGGGIVYVLFACVLVAPLFIAPVFINGWREAFNSNVVYAVYFMVLFVLAALPGGLYFKKNFLSRLRRLGYFKKRQY